MIRGYVALEMVENKGSAALTVNPGSQMVETRDNNTEGGIIPGYPLMEADSLVRITFVPTNRKITIEFVAS